MKAVNEVGNVYGLLTVVRRRASVSGKAAWYCRCACGGSTTLFGDTLRRGLTKSCGCYRKSGDYKITHGHSRRIKTATYTTWVCMLNRCTRPTDVGYHNYGGRGITVCERWRTFENFLQDMGERPKGLTLDREDKDGPYSKSNCKWATKSEQIDNRRNARRITYEGRTLTLNDWAEKLGLQYGTLYYRVFVAKMPLALALRRT